MNPGGRNGIISSTGPVIIFYRKVLAESGAGEIIYGAIILERVTRIPDFRPGIPSRSTILLVHIALTLEYAAVILEYNWNLYAKRSRNQAFPECRAITHIKGTDPRVFRSASAQSVRTQQQK